MTFNKTIGADAAFDLCIMALKAVGCDSFTQNAVARGLVETSLRGVDSHGLRLLPHYLRSAKCGRKNPTPNFSIKTLFPSILSLDADNAFGHAAGFYSIDKAIEVAKSQGVCAVSVFNSSHPGAMASFALEAARKGYACFAFTNADSLLISSNGRRPFFGTNPICFAAPRGEEYDQFCLDMAPTFISWNKLKALRLEDIPLPSGVAADSDGLEVTDGWMASSLFPIGDYKGYGLAAMVEILCGVLTGGGWGRGLPAMFEAPMNQGRHLSQFYLVMRVDISGSLDQFKARMIRLAQEISDEPSRDSNAKVLLPNDIEIRTYKVRSNTGIPLIDSLYLELKMELEELGKSIDQYL